MEPESIGHLYQFWMCQIEQEKVKIKAQSKRSASFQP